MTGATITAGRLGLMLTELRLPTIKRLATDVCAQSDREGWPGHQLPEALLEHEMAERCSAPACVFGASVLSWGDSGNSAVQEGAEAYRNTEHLVR